MLLGPDLSLPSRLMLATIATLLASQVVLILSVVSLGLAVYLAAAGLSRKR